MREGVYDAKRCCRCDGGAVTVPDFGGLDIERDRGGVRRVKRFGQKRNGPQSTADPTRLGLGFELDLGIEF